VGLRNAGLRGQEQRPLRSLAGRFGFVVAGLLIVAGTTTVFDASSFVSGSAPPAQTLSCNDTWTGGGAVGDWGSAANWTAGVPNSTRADVCISGNANVLLTTASFSIGQLTVSAGSSLTIGSSTTTSASLIVSLGSQNDGSLTVDPSGTSGHPGLTIEGPITNTGTLTVNGTVGLGSTTSAAMTNDGTIGVAAGGLINMNGSSTLANEQDGLLAFGIDGSPGSVAASGRITNGTLSLAGSADPVFEDGFVPSAGAEYFVDTGTSSGAFASVLHGASADYSHADEVGLIGGGPPTATSTRVSSSVGAGLHFGQSVTLTATVVPVSGSDPTGSVSFFADGDPLGSSPVKTSATGVTAAALDLSSLPVGSDSITATYGGDVVFAAGKSPVLTQVVNQDTTNITITPSSPSPQPGQPVIDTATVSLVTPGTGTPTGTVSFTDDGSPVAACQSLSLPTVAPLQVACTETYESDATHAILASYSGDEDDAGSTASLLQSVGQIPTQTTVASSSPTSTYGQGVTLTATVTPAATASATPGGTVTFYDYQTNPIATVGISTVDGSTTATLDISSLTGGRHSITATYTGDATFGSSTSDAPVKLSVAEAPTIVTVASSADSAVLGQAVVFSVSISSSASGETGTVQFVDNGFMIGSSTVSGGQATFQTGALNVGPNPITAVYEGDDDFVGSSSTNTVTLTIGQAPVPTTTSVAPSPPAATSGQSVTLTATVAPTTGTALPDGMVTFSVNGTAVGSSTLSTTDGVTTTSMLLTTLPVGSDSVIASYGGSTGFLASSSASAATVTVTRASTTLGLLASANPFTAGQPVTLTATVFPTTGSGETGVVTFYDDGAEIGTSSVSNGQATLNVFTAPAGDDAITADYTGDDNFIGSSITAPLSQMVGQT
jgi:large repetitive protein